MSGEKSPTKSDTMDIINEHKDSISDQSYNQISHDIKGEALTGQASNLSSPGLSQTEINDHFKPTTIILAKVKGYPAWPAMVLDEKILPGNILRSKPKSRASTTQSSTIRKSISHTRTFPIRFFADDSYIWTRSSDVKILTDDMIREYFIVSSIKRRKDATLEQAYHLAQDPPDMSLFAKWGSRAAPPDSNSLDVILLGKVEVSDVSEDDANPEDTSGGKRDSKRQKRQAEPRPPTKAQLAAARKLAASAAREAEARLMAEYDSDWGLYEFEEYDTTSGSYIFESPLEQSRIFDEELQSAAHVQRKLVHAQNAFQEVCNNLEEQLLSHSIKESSVILNLNSLLVLWKEYLPPTLLAKSRLLRLLILTLRRPEADFPYKRIRTLIHSILAKTRNLNVRPNTEQEINVHVEQVSDSGQEIQDNTDLNLAERTNSVESNGANLSHNVDPGN